MEGMPMTQKSSWVAKAAVLAVMVVAGVAVMTALAAVGEPDTDARGRSAICSADHGAGCAAPLSEIAPAVDPGQQEAGIQPTACRLRPECTSDSDCDVRCGVGLGKCVHSNCPVRICHCH
jgi:hypothetical protein